MAQQPQVVQGGPPPGANDAHAALRTAAGAASQMAQAAHGMMQKAQAPPGPPQGHEDIMAALNAIHSKVGADGGAPGGGNGQSEMWQAFPSTDPNFLQHLQGMDPHAQLGTALDMFAQEEQRLSEFHQGFLAHLMAGLSTPGEGVGSPPAGAPPPETPGVGGDLAGGY